MNTTQTANFLNEKTVWIIIIQLITQTLLLHYLWDLMLSLYIHIPFCAHKCSYCSFFVLPEEELAQDKEEKLEEIKQKYLDSLLAEQKHWHERFPEEWIRSIYIGGGTPFELGPERLLTLVDSVLATRDTEHLEELTIELNPDPFDDVLKFIDTASTKRDKLYKLRFSIGIQTFDDTVLEASKRNYFYNNLVWFLRELQFIKKQHVHYSFDFIAFGKGPVDKGIISWRSEEKMKFFYNFVHSRVADGFSLYTLELMPGSDRYNTLQHGDAWTHMQRLQGEEEWCIDEFAHLRAIVQQAGYRRYEISNFALLGRESIHNTMYRTHQPYIGLGIHSSSYLPKKRAEQVAEFAESGDEGGVRFRNTGHRKQYLKQERTDPSTHETLSLEGRRQEEVLLSLRRQAGLTIDTYTDLFVPERKELLEHRAQEDFITLEEGRLRLTDMGMALYNALVTELLEDIT